jgi:hypothetical protein
LVAPRIVSRRLSDPARFRRSNASAFTRSVRHDVVGEDKRSKVEQAKDDHQKDRQNKRELNEALSRVASRASARAP